MSTKKKYSFNDHPEHKEQMAAWRDKWIAPEAYGYHASKGLVLAQGESRQHFHAFRDTDQVELWHVPANDNKKEKLYVVLKTPQTLVHEEHDPIERNAGVHRFGFQFEETFEGEYRRVAD